MASFRDVISQLWTARGPLFTVLAILGALPVLFLVEDETMPVPAQRCLYVLVVMAFLWVTEALPVTVTALLPIVMFPMAGVLPAKQISGYYVNDTIMLFLGGLVVALAIEEWNLHKRIAILILKGVGSEPKWLMLGLMLPTWFLSMWISNTAAASMMIPIANAIIQQTKSVKRKESHPYADKSDSIHMEVIDSKPCDVSDSRIGVDNGHCGQEERCRGDGNSISVVGQAKPKVTADGRSKKITIALTLCVAYASNIGGIATLTGTPPNLVMRGIADEYYVSYQLAAKSNDTSGSGVTFVRWMAMALPLSFLTLILAWLILVLVFMTGRGCCTSNAAQNKVVKRLVDKEWKKLGRMTLAEIEVLIVFVVLTILWLSRDPKESPGWASWFKSGYVSDSVCSVSMAILLFVLPATCPRIGCRTHGKSDQYHYSPLLTWKKAQAGIPWGVVLLVGGGFALANACKESGLSKWLGEQMATLDYLDTWVFNLVICLIVAGVTEVTSNTATATLIMPILADMAVALKINPLYLMMSATIATSFAFMLPVATPPNAIVFSYGQIRIFDMASVGILMNLMAVGTVTLCVNTWGQHIFYFDQFDPIFNATLPVKGLQ